MRGKGTSALYQPRSQGGEAQGPNTSAPTHPPTSDLQRPSGRRTEAECGGGCSPHSPQRPRGSCTLVLTSILRTASSMAADVAAISLSTTAPSSS